jgi:hypothetical protein
MTGSYFLVYSVPKRQETLERRLLEKRDWLTSDEDDRCIDEVTGVLFTHLFSVLQVSPSVQQGFVVDVDVT